MFYTDSSGLSYKAILISHFASVSQLLIWKKYNKHTVFLVFPWTFWTVHAVFKIEVIALNLEVPHLKTCLNDFCFKEY